MSDILTPAQRSALMAKVRGAGNASTELRLIAMFRALRITGWRRGATIRAASPRSESLKSKVGRRKFQVRPDFVFPKLPPSPRLRRTSKLAIFVDGCFWHGCPLHATQPKQNAEFWRTKIAKNQIRDRLVTRTLRRAGWRVLRIWEHELTRKYEPRLLARMRRIGLLDFALGTQRASAEMVAPQAPQTRPPRRGQG